MECVRGDILTADGRMLAAGVDFTLEDREAHLDPQRFHGSAAVPKAAAAAVGAGESIRIEIEDGMALAAHVDRTSLGPEDDEAVIFFS
jgi:hypothetical protein